MTPTALPITLIEFPHDAYSISPWCLLNHQLRPKMLLRWTHDAYPMTVIEFGVVQHTETYKCSWCFSVSWPMTFLATFTKPWRLLGALSFLVLFFSWRLLSFPFGVMTLIRWRALSPMTLIECAHDAYWMCLWRLLSLLMTLIALPMTPIELPHDVY